MSNFSLIKQIKDKKVENKVQFSENLNLQKYEIETLEGEEYLVMVPVYLSEQFEESAGEYSDFTYHILRKIASKYKGIIKKK